MRSHVHLQVCTCDMTVHLSPCSSARLCVVSCTQVHVDLYRYAMDRMCVYEYVHVVRVCVCALLTHSGVCADVCTHLRLHADTTS